jgi:O-antigen/teichoic acid export membrane protein
MNLKGKKEAVYAFAWSLLSKFFSYLLLLVVANYYLKAEFGRASFVISLYSLTFAIAFLGATNIFTAWYIKKKDCSSIFYFMALLTAAATIIWIAVSINHLWIMPFALILPINLLNTVSSGILNSKYRYDITQSNSALFIIIIIAGAVLMAQFGKSGLILAYAFGYVITSFRLMFVARKELWAIIKKFRIKFRSIKEYLAPAIAVTLISFSFSFLGWLDSTVLGLLSTFENVAIYSVAGPIANVLTLIPLSLGGFLLARAAEIENKEISKNVLRKAIRVSYTISIIFAVALAALLGLIYSVFFPNYIGNEVYTMILSIGILLYGVYYLVYTYTIGELNPGKGLVPIGTAALINLILDIILIPKFGIYGIAIATAFAHLIAFTLLLKKTGMLKENLKLLVPILLIPIAFYMSYWGLILIPICLLFLISMKILQKEDFAVIKKTIFTIFKKNENK